MLLLKHNTLDFNDLITIERQYLRWSKSSRPFVTTEFNVLDYNRTDLYGHLLGMFDRLGVLSTLDVTVSQLLDFLVDVDLAYNDTPYHSFYHAADVVSILYFAMTHLEAKSYLTQMEIAVLFVAAVCHDVGHPGFNNDYQIKTKSEHAIRYNNKSVLESLSIDTSLILFEKHQILKTPDQIDLFKRLILATDMTFHYDLLEEARQLEDTLYMWDTPMIHTWEERDRVSFAKILLHAADISNTVRIWPISKQWSDLIVQEFFRQGDAEKLAGLPVSPGMDRDFATQASISLKFGDFIVKPYFEALCAILPKASIWIETLEENRLEWENLKENTPLATSIGNYSRNSYVSVPAGTVVLPMTLETRLTKPMPISRASSHSNILISPPQSSISSELRRNSVQHIVS
ncbi:hypothetical protein RMCBS344292_02232 [Rhizopus microsporus]|nr:hypothetical protein RMCBS344292_02232 [Rhizopus microsporus]